MKNDILFDKKYIDSSYKNYFAGWNKALKTFQEVMKEENEKKQSYKTFKKTSPSSSKISSNV